MLLVEVRQLATERLQILAIQCRAHVVQDQELSRVADDFRHLSAKIGVAGVQDLWLDRSFDQRAAERDQLGEIGDSLGRTAVSSASDHDHIRFAVLNESEGLFVGAGLAPLGRWRHHVFDDGVGRSNRPAGAGHADLVRQPGNHHAQRMPSIGNRQQHVHAGAARLLRRNELSILVQERPPGDLCHLVDSRPHAHHDIALIARDRAGGLTLGDEPIASIDQIDQNGSCGRTATVHHKHGFN